MSTEQEWTVATALEAICAGDSGEFWQDWMEEPAQKGRAYLDALEAENRRVKEELEATVKALRDYQHDHHSTNQSWFEEAKKLAAQLAQAKEELEAARWQRDMFDKAGREVHEKLLTANTQLAQAQARAALADELADNFRARSTLARIFRDWLASYDAISSPTTKTEALDG